MYSLMETFKQCKIIPGQSQSPDFLQAGLLTGSDTLIGEFSSTVTMRWLLLDVRKRFWCDGIKHEGSQSASGVSGWTAVIRKWFCRSKTESPGFSNI